MKINFDDNKIVLSDFVFDRKYKYKDLERNDEEIRTYTVNTKKVPSVTTILSATQSKEKQEGLQKWREQVGTEQATRITNQAATRGTEMHYVIEKYLNGQGYLNLTEQGATARNMAHVILQNMSDIKTVYGTEVHLYYKQLWAGTCDLVCETDGVLTLGDFKQSNKMKKEEWITDYYYQLAAYSLAHTDLFDEVKKCIVLMCTPNLEFQKFTISNNTLLQYQDLWMQRVDKYYELLEV